MYDIHSGLALDSAIYNAFVKLNPYYVRQLRRYAERTTCTSSSEMEAIKLSNSFAAVTVVDLPNK